MVGFVKEPPFPARPSSLSIHLQGHNQKSWGAGATRACIVPCRPTVLTATSLCNGNRPESATAQPGHSHRRRTDVDRAATQCGNASRTARRLVSRLPITPATQPTSAVALSWVPLVATEAPKRIQERRSAITGNRLGVGSTPTSLSKRSPGLEPGSLPWRGSVLAA